MVTKVPFARCVASHIDLTHQRVRPHLKSLVLSDKTQVGKNISSGPMRVRFAPIQKRETVLDPFELACPWAARDDNVSPS